MTDFCRRLWTMFKIRIKRIILRKIHYAHTYKKDKTLILNYYLIEIKILKKKTLIKIFCWFLALNKSKS